VSGPANQNDEGLTLKAVGRNPWNAVDRSLPDDADRTLLERTAFAARECAKAAFAAARVAEVTEPDLVAAYERRSAEAADRDQEARHRLGQLAPDQMSTVSPFLDPERVHKKALRNLMIEVESENNPLRETVTAATIDKNPWSLMRGDLTGVAPELLHQVQDAAMGLVLDAWERRDGSYTPEEASLWDRYASLARNLYAEAECELAIAPRTRGDQDWAAEVLTAEMIAGDPRSAVDLDIPSDASPELLSLIAATAEDLGRLAEHRASLAVREEDEIELRVLGGEARQRQREAETLLAALGALREGPQGVEPVESPRKAADKEYAALIDMLGEAVYRAVNEPVPRDADPETLVWLSDDLDAALDRLEVLSRSGGLMAISLELIAGQVEKAGARQVEVEALLEHMDPEIDRARTGIGIEDKGNLSVWSYGHYPDVMRDDGEPEHEIENDRPDRGR
jgi:hypothetical protein